MSLQMEALKATNEELEKKYAESEAKNAGLHRQVQHWAKLDSRESSDLENLRKSRMELEVKVKQLEAERDEVERQRAAEETRAEKWKQKVDKYKDAWAAHTVCLLLSPSSILCTN